MNITLNNFTIGFKARRQKFGFGSFVFLFLFGAAFTAIGIFPYLSTRVDKNWTKTEGIVVGTSSSISDGSTSYDPIVSYKVSGQTQKITGSGSSSYPSSGSKRTVAYNPIQPAQAKVVEGTGITLLMLLFPVLGVLLVLSAPLLFVRTLKRSNKIRALVQTGQKLQGILVDVKTTGLNNSNSYKLVVSATDLSGTVQNYVSDSIRDIGGVTLIDFRKNPIAIDVYIDPANPKNYYVDIADIPSLTPQKISELIKSASAR